MGLITEKGYYLGVTKDGEKVYMPKPSWDCGWYWGFGYLEGYNVKGRPSLKSHTHWDCTVANSGLDAFDAMKKKFRSLSISDEDLWKLCDLMDSFYTLKSAAEVMMKGGSNYTSKAYLRAVEDKDEVKKINEQMLPAVFEAIDDIFNELAVAKEAD